nr:hypothetical protein [Marinicella sp. W31]MDC2878272.1 hypothetical protein [Marinicella sp. W31]
MALAGTQAMVIVAGLPVTTYGRSLQEFSKRFPDVIVQGTPASISDGALYPKRYVQQLVQDVGQFILRRRKTAADNRPRRKSIFFRTLDGSRNASQGLRFFRYAYGLVRLGRVVSPGKAMSS